MRCLEANIIMHLFLPGGADSEMYIGTAMDANPMPAPTMILPTRSTSLLKAAPMTTAPTAKMRLAQRMMGLRPKRSLRGPPRRENSQAAAT